jgi:hypothetical protein
MTLTEILTEARARLDDKKAPYLWGDGEIVGYLNEAINEVAEKKKLFRDSKTAAICQVPLLAVDTFPDYVLDPRVTEIVSAKVRTQTLFMGRTCKADLEAWNPGWRSATHSTPWKYLTDYSEGFFSIFPMSSINDTIDLTVYRLPLVQMSMASPGASPEIHFKFHGRLFNGILCRAYLKEDSETLDPQKATTHTALWVKDMGEIGKSRIQLHNSGQFLGPHYGAI